MNRVAITSFLIVAMGLAGASDAGVINSIQRLDDDITPSFNEILVSNGLTAGAQAYSDTTFTYGILPSYLTGADYIRMTNGDRVDANYQLQLTLNQLSPSTC
jgi:hypothetical protein